MAKINVMGDTIVITSEMTLEGIKNLEKYSPKALCLVEADEDGVKNEVFRVSTTTGKGSINRFGASFGSCTHDAAKKATVTMTLPSGINGADAVKDYAEDAYGAAVMYLNQIEAGYAAATAEVEKNRAEVRANIVVA